MLRKLPELEEKPNLQRILGKSQSRGQRAYEYELFRSNSALVERSFPLTGFYTLVKESGN